MRNIFWTVITILALTGCGGNPDNPYTTMLIYHGPMMADVTEENDQWVEDQQVEDQSVEDQHTENDQQVEDQQVEDQWVEDQWVEDLSDTLEDTYDGALEDTLEDTYEDTLEDTYQDTLDTYEDVDVFIPEEKIYISLEWEHPPEFCIPGSPVEGCHANIDLHFVPVWPDNPPEWSSIYDCHSLVDKCSDWDDYDGLTYHHPYWEWGYLQFHNITWNDPVNGSYAVGVLDYPKGWGEDPDSTVPVTFELWIEGNLVLEKVGVELKRGDFWDVARIDWPSGEVTEVLDENGELVISSDFCIEDPTRCSL